MELSQLGPTISWINLIAWVVFGLIAGGVAQYVSVTSVRGGMSMAMLLGILGSVSGGALATFLYGIGMQGIDLTSLAIAVFASLGFLLLYHYSVNKKSLS